MKFLLVLIGWCILFVLSWPLALLVLVLWPIIWLICLPFRLLGFAVHGVFSGLRSLLGLPAQIFSKLKSN